MATDLRLRQVGLSACLLEVLPTSVAALTRYLRDCHSSGALPGVVDIVPGACTVLLDGLSPRRVAQLLEPLLAAWDDSLAGPVSTPEAIEVPVTYNGPDLKDVARRAGISEDGVIALHTSAPMPVIFCGFAPGFPYIGQLPVQLRMPRLSVPRKAVPAGSVAIAEEYTGIYPRPSPGGWRILGHTSIELWNPDHVEPARLSPGRAVQFTPV